MNSEKKSREKLRKALRQKSDKTEANVPVVQLVIIELNN